MKETVRERDIERYLGLAVKGLGGLYLKFVSPGNAGVPDRIIVLPNGSVMFVELKTSSGRLSESQRLQIERLKAHKANVHVLYGMAGADELISEMKQLLLRGDDGWEK